MTISHDRLRILQAHLEHILNLQTERMFVLTGFYLDLEHLAILIPLLDHDDPPTGARGRYQRVPVHSKSALETLNDIHKVATAGNIAYTYVQMDVVN